jgi:hypothetical protein
MSILHGAGGTNDNTIVYIVNALNGEIKQVNTLATTAGQIAQEAADGVETVVLVISNVREEFANELELKANIARLELTETTVADLENQYGEVVASAVQLASRTSTLEQTATSLTTSFVTLSSTLGQTEDSLEEVRSWIQESADGILIGKSNSPVKMRITNDQIQIIENNNVITYWSNQAQLTPQSLTIPQGGSLTLGSFRFVPRSSGNLSLVKV